MPGPRIPVVHWENFPMSRITLQFIADQLGISKFAVSRALTGKPGVSDETRRAVVSTAERLGYTGRPPKAAEVRSFEVLFHDRTVANRELWVDVQHGIEQEASRRGYPMAIRWSNDHTMIERLERSTIGFVLVGPHEKRMYEAAREVRRAGDHRQPHRACARQHGPDHRDRRRGGRPTSRDFLVGLGHRRLVYVHGRLGYPGRYARLRGFAEAIAGVDGAELREIAFEEDQAGAGFSAALMAMVGDGFEPTCFFCGSDDVALTVVSELMRIGLAIPEDVSVVGHADYPIATQISPKLTTVHMPHRQMGIAAVRDAPVAGRPHHADDRHRADADQPGAEPRRAADDRTRDPRVLAPQAAEIATSGLRAAAISCAQVTAAAKIAPEARPYARPRLYRCASSRTATVRTDSRPDKKNDNEEQTSEEKRSRSSLCRGACRSCRGRDPGKCRRLGTPTASPSTSRSSRATPASLAAAGVSVRGDGCSPVVADTLQKRFGRSIGSIDSQDVAHMVWNFELPQATKSLRIRLEDVADMTWTTGFRVESGGALWQVTGGGHPNGNVRFVELASDTAFTQGRIDFFMDGVQPGHLYSGDGFSVTGASIVAGAAAGRGAHAARRHRGPVAWRVRHSA